MSVISKLSGVVKRAGGYKCPHFVIKIIKGQGKGCCGSQGQDYAPICKLTGTICTGLAQCPRLSITQKSTFIEQWREDLAINKPVNPQQYLER